ncbi:S9 family peptidase [Kangiella sediminilitoris]
MKAWLATAGALTAFGLMSSIHAAETQKTSALTLEQVMAYPDWIGNAPESPYWSDDGQAIFYKQKMQGQDERRVWRLELGNNKLTAVRDAELFEIDSPQGDISPDGKLKVYNLRGDLYLKYLESGEVRQLTKTHANEGTPQFVGNDTVAYRDGNGFFTIDVGSGLLSQLVDIQLKDNPEDKEEDGYLEKQQTRYFDYIREQQEKRDYNKKREKEITESSPRTANNTWYLGDDKGIHTLSLSPNGKFVVLSTYNKSESEGKNDNMPRFVTEDGYVENEKVRPLVGTYTPRNETLYLLDLTTGEKTELNYDSLPEFDDDPLADIKRATAKRNGEKYKADKDPRNVFVFDWIPNQGISWNDSGDTAAVLLYSADNKDRWLVSIDTEDKELETEHHLRDKAWINDWNFNDFGWVNDDTIYFTAEDTGYSQLYVKELGDSPDALTKGRYIVDSVVKDPNSNYLYYRANKKHPGIYEVYRVKADGNESEVVTDLGGKNDFVLSPDGQKLVITHSEALNPPELFLVDANGGEAKQLTYTTSEKFESIPWTQPEYVEVPSRDVDQPIYARLYKPEGFDENRAEKYPAVIFIHGAGYLQNAHQGWSLYFREFMFHTFLNQKGYVVMDIDYRGSAGYGRDWRTAVYRQMGTPEVVDLIDGANWMEANVNVDRDNVGIYGGSYGGFLTFMGLFTAPEEFAAGASLRPVTDWVHYNHPYTSNILNTPEVDPVAYERSSPIEFAEGLNKPLLIAHGMVDDNVFFKDTVRLVQRLIELEKTEYFETAIYPVEPHGFKEPSSWLDEYKRIYYLFEEHLKD